MSFKLSQRSLDNLEGVHEDLISVAKAAIDITTVDFAVIEGLRTVEKQKELVEKGASQTMNSKHLEGKAIDVMAYVDGRGCWELNVYDEIAEAFKLAGSALYIPIRWGAAWTVPSILDWSGTMEEAMNSYIDQRRSEGRRPFIDAPHFELLV